MKLKKTIFILMSLVLIGSTNAAFIVRNNGGFDADAAGWNATGGGAAWAPAHVATGGNPGGYLTLQADNNTWTVWYQVINEDLAEWGIAPGATITVQADVIDLGAAGNSNQCGLKIESWNSALLNEAAATITATNSWATYSFDYTINPAADSVKMVVTNVNYNGQGVAKYGYDNVSIGFPEGLTPALFPIPAVGNAVSPTSSVLNWTNPEPLKNPSDTVTCDVWFRESATPLTDPNLVPDQSGVVKIVSNEAGNSVDLSAKGITLQPDYYYYWKVDVIDPNNGGGPIVIDGFTWSFNTGDAPPVVDAGTDQYVWLQDGLATFTLTGSIVDDGKSDVDIEWAYDAEASETDPATIVTINSPDKETTTVTVDNTGWFFFNLTATDAVSSDVDTVNIGVYVDACAAAKADPGDIPATYPDGHGDVDGDCDIDLNDFALMAATWLDCMSEKLDCTQ